LLAAAPALFGQARIADSLQRAPEQAPVAVFLMLRNQPQGEIFQREHGASSFWLEATERRLRSLMESGPISAIQAAKASVDQALLDVRRRSFRAIEEAIAEDQSSVETLLNSLGARRIGRYKAVNMLTAEVRPSQLAALAAHPAIAEIVPAITLRTQLANSVPGLGAVPFWTSSWTGAGQSVAVLDSGIVETHPAFAGKTIVSRVFLDYGQLDTTCFGDDASSTSDLFGHGTHVSGIVASQGSTGFESNKGVAPGASLYNLKVAYKGIGPCNGSGRADSRDLTAAIDWMVQNTPVKIANVSLGSPEATDDDHLSRALDQIADQFGVLFSVAAGNGTGCRISTPAHAYNVMAVSNYQTRGTMYPSNCPGPTIAGRHKPDLAAPGAGIVSTSYNWAAAADYFALSGTSMSAPHIAGSAALLASAGLPDALAIRASLVNTTDNDGWAADRGWGYTNLTNTHAQFEFSRTALLSGASSPGSFHLYELPAVSKVKASAAWNRHVAPGTSIGVLNDIDVFAYSSTTGAVLSQSVDPIQSIQQVVATSGPAVVKVKMVTPVPGGGVSQEKYGVAFNQSATLRGGPVLRPLCTAPAAVAAGANVTLNCTLANSGDLPAFGSAISVSLPSGFSGTPSASFGTVNAGAAPQLGISLVAPVTGGTYNLAYGASSTSFGETFTGGASLNINVVGIPAAPTNPNPPNGSGVPAGPATLSWSPSSAATSYDVYFGTSAVPPQVTNTSATSYAVGPLPAGGVYYWRVVARNEIGQTSSPTWWFTTNSVTGLTLSANPVTGGASLTGTVSLAVPAPVAGLSVLLSSSSGAASVPASVLVPGGA
jgi:subtilisin family serine protease